MTTARIPNGGVAVKTTLARARKVAALASTVYGAKQAKAGCSFAAREVWPSASTFSARKAV